MKKAVMKCESIYETGEEIKAVNVEIFVVCRTLVGEEGVVLG